MSHCRHAVLAEGRPALIERLLPVQKLSAEAYKEQMAVQRQDAHRAWQLLERTQAADPQQSLHPRLPAASDRRPSRDLEIFEKLMAHGRRVVRRPLEAPARPKEILATLSIARIADYFIATPEASCLHPRRWIGRSQNTKR